LSGRPSVLGTVAARGVPREMALEPGRAMLLVSNFEPEQLEAVAVNGLG
jgi:hypothetical protein